MNQPVNTVTTGKADHHGRNVKRLREIFGIKQETLAADLGITQQAVSKLEEREKIDDHIVEKLAAIFNIAKTTIREFDEVSFITAIQRNLMTTQDFMPMLADRQLNTVALYRELFDKLVAVMDENRRLYESLLREKDQRIALLQGRAE